MAPPPADERDVSFERFQELGADLRTRLGAGAASEFLNEWVGGDLERQSFLNLSVFGAVRWNRLRGRPRNAPLRSAVVVEHRAQVLNKYTNGWDWDYHDVPFTYDLPDDGDDHRIGFVCRAVPLSVTSNGDNDVFVYPAAGVTWESVERPGGLGDPRYGFGYPWTALQTDGLRILPDFVFS